MSPFFFIIDMQGLNDILKIAKANEWIRGFNVNSRTIDNSLEISHLKYVDNTPVSCVFDKDQLKCLGDFDFGKATSGLIYKLEQKLYLPRQRGKGDTQFD